MRSVAKTLLNQGNSGERRLGRMLSRGRVRGLSEELNRAISIADQIVKDFGAAPPADAMVGADVHTNAVGPPKRKKTRLSNNL